MIRQFMQDIILQFQVMIMETWIYTTSWSHLGEAYYFPKSASEKFTQIFC